jgi:hypothetical protein
MIHISALAMGQTHIHAILEDAMITLLLATIIGGSIASSAKAGIIMLPNLGFKISIKRED